MKNFNFLVVLAHTGLIWSCVGVAWCDEVRFNRDVLPILAENCFSCHGFDSASREADLRLDTAEGVLAGRDGGGVVVPGDPQSSELISRILSSDRDMLMPPPESGKRLTPSEQAILHRWIEQGAEYEPHWAFLPPAPIQPPSSEATPHPIDRFIQTRFSQRRTAAGTGCRLGNLDPPR